MASTSGTRCRAGRSNTSAACNRRMTAAGRGHPHREPRSPPSRREAGASSSEPQGGEWELFDDVVFATHSDQTLRLLADATPAWNAGPVGAIRYQPNEAVLHADASLMPRSRKVWSSLVLCRAEDRRGRTGST